jgi:hypothetical protein
LERGWHDMIVDPRRYRLPRQLTPFVRLLGHMVPRPDVVLVLSGDPDRLHERKPEIGSAEVARQVAEWRDVAPSAGRRVVEVNTVRSDPAHVGQALLAAMSNAERTWRRVPLTSRRLGMCMTGDAREGLAFYQPQSTRARAAAAVTGSGLPLPKGRRVPSPIDHLDDLWRLLGIRPSGVSAMLSSTPGRVVLSVCTRGRMDLVVKVGGHADDRLRHEAAMLAAPELAGLAVGRPELVWQGEWRDSLVVATRALRRSSSAPWSVSDVVPITQALAAGVDGAPLTHGDFAPWNLIRTAEGPFLLDWESSRWADEPLHDLTHFVVQGGALLGRYSPDHAVALLCAAGSPGAQLLTHLGRDCADARGLLDDYLVSARPTDPRAIRFRDAMLRTVGA